MVWVTAISALVLAAVAVFAGKLRFLDVIPRSRWLSAAGGVAVAYVFIHLLPELNRHQTTVAQLGYDRALVAGYTVYLIALFGLIVFYGLERAAKTARRRQRQAGDTGDVTRPVFTLHIVSFAVYNAIIGYLLVHREVPGIRSLLLFVLALGLHFFTNDYGLRQNFRERYHRLGRWVLAGAVLVGWLIGILTTLHPLVVPVLFAFLAGGVVLNVLKEELPAERESSFWAFAAGVIAYAAILLIR